MKTYGPPPTFFQLYLQIKLLPNRDIFKTAKCNSRKRFSFYSRLSQTNIGRIKYISICCSFLTNTLRGFFNFSCELYVNSEMIMELLMWFYNALMLPDYVGYDCYKQSWITNYTVINYLSFQLFMKCRKIMFNSGVSW